MTVPVARPVATLTIPPIVATPREPLVLAEGAPVPHGCFARSAQGDAVACVVGQWDTGAAPVKLVVFRSDASSLAPIELTGPLTGSMRDAVNEVLRSGDFGPFEDPPVRLGVGAERWFHRLQVRLEERARREDPLDLRTTVRIDAPAPSTPPPPVPSGDPEPIETPSPVLWANSLADVDCESASVSVRELSVRALLVERECRSGSSLYLAATVCNADLAQCD